jgi:hypothetical protein
MVIEPGTSGLAARNSDNFSEIRKKLNTKQKLQLEETRLRGTREKIIEGTNGRDR